MKSQCIQAVFQALGRSLTAPEIQGVEARIARNLRQLAAKDRQAFLAMSPADRLTLAAQNAAQELVHEAAKKRQRVALAILAHDRLEKAGADSLDGLDRVNAFHADGKSQVQSVESQTRAIHRIAVARLSEELDALGDKFLGLISNGRGAMDLLKEIRGEPSSDPVAAKAAKTWKETTDALRERFNAAGGDIHRLEDWGMPQGHDRWRVFKAGKDAWTRFVLPLLDRRRYVKEDGSLMDDAETTEFLGHAWDTVATGGINKWNPGQPHGFGMRANRGNASRMIHFKNADAYAAYHQDFGAAPILATMVDHLRAISRDIALVETYGPNPNHMFAHFKERAVQKAVMQGGEWAGKAQARAVKSERLYEQVAGRGPPVADERLANWSSNLRHWLIASRLGSAVVTSLSDEATLHLVAKVNGLPAGKILTNELQALKGGNARHARRAGLALDTLIGAVNRYGEERLFSGLSQRLASFTLRASGLQFLTDARRQAFGVTMMDALGHLTREKEFADLDPHDAHYLKAAGATAEDWAVWKLATPEAWGGGHAVLTPESIMAVPDAALAPLGDPVRLRERAATKLLGAVLDETNMAVIEPGARERALMHGGTQAGTWKGEATRSFFLFKSFPVAMIARHFSRAWNRPTRGGTARYLAALFVGATVMGGLAVQVNELASGRDPRDMTDERFYGMALLKGGSLGLFGDFLMSQSTQHGNTFLGALEGPAFGLLEDAYQATLGAAVKKAQGEEPHVGANLVKLLKGLTPGTSLWYAKAALDRMIFHQLQEFLSPGYLDRMRARAQREFGQSYWWKPEKGALYRALKG